MQILQEGLYLSPMAYMIVTAPQKRTF